MPPVTQPYRGRMDVCSISIMLPILCHIIHILLWFILLFHTLLVLPQHTWRVTIAFVHAQIRPPPDEQHLPLSFDFPEGSLIGIAKEKLPVTVTFTGTRPTSFTANVVFLDEDGKRFSLPITGTTDASVITVSAFLQVLIYVMASLVYNPASIQKSNSFERKVSLRKQQYEFLSLWLS